MHRNRYFRRAGWLYFEDSFLRSIWALPSIDRLLRRLADFIRTAAWNLQIFLESQASVSLIHSSNRKAQQPDRIFSFTGVFGSKSGMPMLFMGVRKNSQSLPVGSPQLKNQQEQQDDPKKRGQISPNGVLHGPGAQPAGLECGYFDVQPVQQISKALLLTLATVCVEKTTGDPFSSPKSVAGDVKQEMIDYIAQQCERHADQGRTDQEEQQQPVSVIEGFLENFVRSKKMTLLRRVVSSKFLLGSITSNSSSSSEDERIVEAAMDVDRSGVWPSNRRDSLAKMLLKRVDRGGRIHCARRFEGNEELMQHKLRCNLRPVDCPSHGCDAIFSAARSAEHDSLCLFKLLPCEQKCKAMVMRGEMEMHCASICEMRPVDCPFLAVGCSKRIPQSQMQRHCELEMTAHLMSVLQLLQKLDNSTESQSQRIILLEKAVSIAQRFEATDVGSLLLRLRDQESKIKSLEQDLSKLRQEMKATDVSAEVLQLRRELRSLQKRIEINPNTMSSSSNSPSSTSPKNLGSPKQQQQP